MPGFAEAMSRLGTETAFEVLARAKQLEAAGRDVIHLEIGEPDFDTPKNIVEAAKRALDEGYTHYGPSAGLPEFRALIAETVSRFRGVSYGPEHVVVTPGGKPILFYVMMAVLDPGDEALYPNPGFPIYESMIQYLGAKAVPLALRQENAFRLDLDEFRDKVGPKTRLVILNSPQNPTGGILPREDVRAIAGILREHPDVWVLSDEIYSRLVFEGEHASIAAEEGMRERTVILDGFSKTYAMTGWRLGYGVMPVELAEWVARIETNCNSCTATFVQRAGMEALSGPQDAPGAFCEEFRERRDVIVEGLNALEGIDCLLPPGAFYVFPDVRGLGRPTREIARMLLEEHGVAALSGTAFGVLGDGHLRFSCANSVANIDRALGRIRDLVQRLRG